MAGYLRYALIYDSESGELGRAALQLLELGIDVLYVNDVDEAALLAEQEAQRLAAVVVPAGCPLGDLDALLARVCPRAHGARSLVVVGREPGAEALAALRQRGVEWCLWRPFDARELRFAVTAAMSADPADQRGALRVPCEVKTTVFAGRHRKEVQVHDASRSGLYLAADNPFLQGTLLSLDVELPGGRLVAKGEVVYANTDDRPVRADVPPGMGVVFSRFAGESEAVLLDFIDAALARFRP